MPQKTTASDLANSFKKANGTLTKRNIETKGFKNEFLFKKL